MLTHPPGFTLVRSAGVAELPVARLLESAVAELGKLLPPAGGAD